MPARALLSFGGCFLEPTVKNSLLVGSHGGHEGQSHAEPWADINDAGIRYKEFVFVLQTDPNGRAGRDGIESINVAAGSADVRSAPGMLGGAGLVPHFGAQDEGITRCGATVSHHIRHDTSLLVPRETRRSRKPACGAVAGRRQDALSLIVEAKGRARQERRGVDM